MIIKKKWWKRKPKEVDEFDWAKKHLKTIKEPHEVQIGRLSGYTYLVTEKHCDCGESFTLWYYQQECPFCNKKYEPITTYFVCM